MRSTASRAAERRPSVMGGRARLRGLSGPGRHHHCTASRIRSTEHRNSKGRRHSAGRKGHCATVSPDLRWRNDPFFQRSGGGLCYSGVRCSVSETRCNGGAFRDRSSPASGPGHPSQMGGVRRRAKQCFATRLPHPWPLLVWPSLAKQLPPGTTIAPLTG